MSTRLESRRPARPNSTPSALAGQTATTMPVTGQCVPSLPKVSVSDMPVEYRQAVGISTEDLRGRLATVNRILFATNNNTLGDKPRVLQENGGAHGGFSTANLTT